MGPWEFTITMFFSTRCFELLRFWCTCINLYFYVFQKVKVTMSRREINVMTDHQWMKLFLYTDEIAMRKCIVGVTHILDVACIYLNLTIHTLYGDLKHYTTECTIVGENILYFISNYIVALLWAMFKYFILWYLFVSCINYALRYLYDGVVVIITIICGAVVIGDWNYNIWTLYHLIYWPDVSCSLWTNHKTYILYVIYMGVTFFRLSSWF